MLDQMIKGALDQMAGADQPAPRVSIAQAMRQARVQRRRQRLTAAGAPVLAAGAALAIALTGVIGGGSARSLGPAEGGVGRRVAPRTFNPLRPYAAFGWLPGGLEKRAGGTFGRTYLELAGEAQAGRITTPVLLNAYTSGECRVTRGSLGCPPSGLHVAPIPLVLGQRVGLVNGQAAYWLPPARTSSLGLRPGTLAWQYARGGWAVEQTYNDLHTALKIARNIRFGPTAGSIIRFPVQLTDVPADWQINDVGTSSLNGVQYASSFIVTAGTVNDLMGNTPTETPQVDAGPGGRNACAGLMYYKTTTDVINGYAVSVANDEKSWPQHELCANDARGVFAWIITGDHPPISPVNLFAHHLRLLGPDPARWTTRPIG
jgi:hypothetical protein